MVYVLNDAEYPVTLTYAGQDVEIVVESVTIGDERQKVSLTVEKKAEGKDIKLPGATLGLYAGEDITSNGGVIVPAGTCVATAVSDATGSVVFDVDLPLGKYLINELQAPVGYVLSDEVIEVEAAYQGQDVDTVEISAVYENKPTKVAISKADATTGVELDGAKLTLLDTDGREIDSWTSVAGEPHIIEGLAIGATYTLREDIAPYGYLISSTVKFTVGDTAEIQKVVMKDEAPTGLSHDHQFNWWFGNAPERGGLLAPPKAVSKAQYWQPHKEATSASCSPSWILPPALECTSVSFPRPDCRLSIRSTLSPRSPFQTCSPVPGACRRSSTLPSPSSTLQTGLPLSSVVYSGTGVRDLRIPPPQ